jgi:hypothetical protein
MSCNLRCIVSVQLQPADRLEPLYAFFDTITVGSACINAHPRTAQAMNNRFASRLTRVAVHAARPARRGVIRALRHHSARTRALAEQLKHVSHVDGIRSWFRGFFFTLRVRAASRRTSLTALLRRPAPLRPPVAKPKAAALTSRRPRRLSTSAGWFAFASR